MAARILHASCVPFASSKCRICGGFTVEGNHPEYLEFDKGFEHRLVILPTLYRNLVQLQALPWPKAAAKQFSGQLGPARLAGFRRQASRPPVYSRSLIEIRCEVPVRIAWIFYEACRSLKNKRLHSRERPTRSERVSLEAPKDSNSSSKREILPCKEVRSSTPLTIVFGAEKSGCESSRKPATSFFSRKSRTGWSPRTRC